MTTTATVDVVVVGAGAAGITDARDLSLQGYSVTPLEARDRIGERTYTTAGVDGDLQLLPYERDCLGGALGGLICSAEKHGIVQLLQSAATYFGQFSFLMETAGQFSPSSSTRALFDAMMTEPSAKLRLNTAVASIDNQGSQVVLTTRGGDQVTARRAIVAVPLNTMRDMTITPELPALARTMIDQGNPSCLSSPPPGKHAFYAVRTEKIRGGDTVFLCMCADGSAIPDDAVERKKVIQDAMRLFVPDIDVVDNAMHNWMTDEFSKGG